MSKDPTSPKKKPTQKRVFDIVPPGKAPASATSRPVIVSHKPQVQDDQLLKAPESHMAGDPDEERSLMSSHDKVALTAPKLDTSDVSQPVAAPASDDLAQMANDLAESISTETDQTNPIPESSVPQETPTKQPTFEPPRENISPEQTPAALAVGQTVETENDHAEPNDDEEDEDREGEHADKPPAGKVMNAEDIIAATNAPMLDRVVVSQHRAKPKTWEWLLVIFLILLLATIALDLLLDAKVINTSLNIPHTHFFKS